MYTIYQPLDGALNHQCARGLYEYCSVFSVNAVSLEDAFRKAQNDFNEAYAKLNTRSTSVGDIIYDEEADLYYMVNGIGFTEVPPTVVNYIDWGMRPIIAEYFAQQMLDHPEDYGLI